MNQTHLLKSEAQEIDFKIKTRFHHMCLQEIQLKHQGTEKKETYAIKYTWEQNINIFQNRISAQIAILLWIKTMWS